MTILGPGDTDFGQKMHKTGGKMRIIEWKLSEITPYENNPRNNEDAVDKVAESIKEFGWQQPIVVDEDGTIIVGHTRLKAAQKLGLETAPVVVAADLDPEQVRAYRLADNKTAEFAEWKFDALEEEISKIGGAVDLTLFGFDIDAFTELPPVEDDGYSGDVPKKPITKPGDIWKLGKHRLMCGDATDSDSVVKLTGGQVDVMITSPPYGVQDGKIREHYDGKKEYKSSFYEGYDDNAGDEWIDLMSGFMDAAEGISSVKFVNVQMLADNKINLIKWLNLYSDKFCDVIVWDKGKAPPQMEPAILNNEFEFIFVFNETGSRVIPFSRFHATESNIIRIGAGKNNYSDIHRAVFPVEIPGKIIELTADAKTYYDPFCGTGTTIIACEQKGKQCFGMELIPAYCDVVVDRWENLTGEKAEIVK